MIPLLRAELIKLRTTRTFVALAGAALGLSLLITLLSTLISKDLTANDVEELFAFDFSRLFILLLGVMGMAGEWRHRTITSTILASPDRLRLLSAKVLAYAVAGALLALVVTVTISAIGTLILSLRGEVTLGAGELVDILWRNLVVAALLGAFGVCVGGIVRNQVAAIVGLLFALFVLEPLLIGLVDDVGRFLPTVGAPNNITGTGPGSDLIAPGVAALLLLGWVALGYVATAATLGRRDLVGGPG